MHDEMTALRMSWAGIRRLLYCADVHLGNASRYQQVGVVRGRAQGAWSGVVARERHGQGRGRA
jgi:hypothetical protein